MISTISSSCETVGEELDAGDDDPRLGAGDSGLEVFGETSVSSEPGEGAFDHPSSWLGFESADALGSGDDLDGPLAAVGDCVEEFVAAIDAVSEDVAEFRERTANGFEQWHGTMVVLDIGGVHKHSKQRAAVSVTM